MKAEKTSHSKKKSPYPEGANVSLCDEFFDKLFIGREKRIDDEKDYCELSHLFGFQNVTWMSWLLERDM